MLNQKKVVSCEIFSHITNLGHNFFYQSWLEQAFSQGSLGSKVLWVCAVFLKLR